MSITYTDDCTGEPLPAPNLKGVQLHGELRAPMEGGILIPYKEENLHFANLDNFLCYVKDRYNLVDRRPDHPQCGGMG